MPKKKKKKDRFKENVPDSVTFRGKRYVYRLHGSDKTRKKAERDAKNVRHVLGTAVVKQFNGKFYIYTRNRPRPR